MFVELPNVPSDHICESEWSMWDGIPMHGWLLCLKYHKIMRTELPIRLLQELNPASL